MPLDLKQLQRFVDTDVPVPDTCDPLYDWEGDVLYVTFERAPADDSYLSDDDVVLRYRDGRLIGMTFLHASSRGFDLDGIPSFPADESKRHSR